jgi:hypothetical protein
MPAPSTCADTVSLTLPRAAFVVQADSHTLRAHPSPFQALPCGPWLGFPVVMASTQVARAAAQLHEAALDVARVAALRSAQPQEPATGPQVPQQSGLADNEDGDDRPVTAGAVADEMAQGTIPEAHP